MENLEPILLARVGHGGLVGPRVGHRGQAPEGGMGHPEKPWLITDGNERPWTFREVAVGSGIQGQNGGRHSRTSHTSHPGHQGLLLSC